MISSALEIKREKNRLTSSTCRLLLHPQNGTTAHVEFQPLLNEVCTRNLCVRTTHSSRAIVAYLMGEDKRRH